MQVPKIDRFAAACLLLALPLFSLAQSLTADQKTTAIQTIARHIAAHYVSPEKGGQISSHLLLASHRGDFNKGQTWKEFDDMVTTSLRKFSGDNHLYVRYDPERVKEMNGRPGDSGSMDEGNVAGAENKYGFAETKVLPGNIGYIRMTEINISDKSLPVLYETMRQVENTNALVIDLRNNGGGGSTAGGVLESYFLPAGKPLLAFTSRSGVVRTDSTVSWLKEKKYAKPVYILINNNTASAAEAFAFVMQQNKRAKIAGETSAGAAYRNEWFIVNDENYVSVSTAAPNLPGTELNWEREGVQPDIKVKKGDALEFLLKKIPVS